MRGISSPWSSVHGDVITEVKSLIQKYPDYSLESAGHSLGGSLTYISYVALAQNFPDKEITSNAMAAFPIGNEAWADFAGGLNGTLNRGNNDGDGVPVSRLRDCLTQTELLTWRPQNMYVSAPYNFKHYGTVSHHFLNSRHLQKQGPDPPSSKHRNTIAQAPRLLARNAKESVTCLARRGTASMA